MRSGFGKVRRKRWLVFLLIFSGFVLLEVFLYARLVSVRATAAGSSPDRGERPVKVMVPVASTGSVYAEVLGRVRARQTVEVRANVPGRVKSVNFARGAEIRKDDVIASMRDYRTEARLEEAGYNLESAARRLRETERVYRKNVLLLEKGIVSEDRTEASRSLFEADSARVKALSAAYERAKWNYDSLRIRSPIDGAVLEVVPDVGQEVRDGDVVARVVSLGGIKVVAGVDASVARLLERGTPLRMSLSAGGGTETAAGEVEGVSRGSDGVSGTYEVEIAVADPGVEWWPGEIVSVRVPVRKLDGVVGIPRTAVVSRGGADFVMAEKNSEVSRVPVTVTWADDRTGYVSFDSLPKGSRIVVEGNLGLRPGDRVRVVD